MEGPQFSTLAESELYRSWGCDVIGMTNMPEAKLAREAEICYASVAMVTDYDCWHPQHDDVEVADIVAVLTGNAERGRALVAALAPRLRPNVPGRVPAGLRPRALDTALITAPEARDPEVLRKPRRRGGTRARQLSLNYTQGEDDMPIKSRIRTIPDYPKPGIQFRDITTLLQDPGGCCGLTWSS